MVPSKTINKPNRSGFSEFPLESVSYIRVTSVSICNRLITNKNTQSGFNFDGRVLRVWHISLKKTYYKNIIKSCHNEKNIMNTIYSLQINIK
jgi:hypothetical protein